MDYITCSSSISNRNWRRKWKILHGRLKELKLALEVSLRLLLITVSFNNEIMSCRRTCIERNTKEQHSSTISSLPMTMSIHSLLSLYNYVPMKMVSTLTGRPIQSPLQLQFTVENSQFQPLQPLWCPKIQLLKRPPKESQKRRQQARKAKYPREIPTSFYVNSFHLFIDYHIL